MSASRALSCILSTDLELVEAGLGYSRAYVHLRAKMCMRFCALRRDSRCEEKAVDWALSSLDVLERVSRRQPRTQCSWIVEAPGDGVCEEAP
jgi:hypothetical protein